MRAFIMLALFGSMAFAASVTEEGQQGMDRRYGDGWGMRNSETDTLRRIGKNDIENPRHKHLRALRIGKDEIQNPRDKIRDAAGEVKHDATREAMEDTNQDGRADMRYYGYKWTMNLRAGKRM